MQRILVVDDIAQNLYLLEVLLEGSGFDVATAKNGVEALALARQAPPDVILSDILMPEMDGYALCREWRADERLQKIPFIFYTATFTEPKDEALALSLGADRFVVKPQEPEVLVGVIREVLAAPQGGESRATAAASAQGAEVAAAYGEAVFRKLEKKMAELGRLNEELEQRIAESARIQKSLRDAQELLDEVGDIAKIGGWKMDLQTRKATWTRGTYAIVGIEPGQPIPGPDEHVDYYLPEFRPLVVEAMRALIEDDKPLAFEAQLRTRQGEVKWCRANGRSLREGGKVVGVYGTFQDVTERKLAELELQFSKEYLANIINAIGDPLFVKDERFRFVLVNDALCRFLGKTPQELLGFTGAEFLPSEQMDHFLAVDRQVLASGEENLCEEVVTGHDGQLRTSVTRKTRYVDPQGAKFIVGAIRDATETKRTHEMLAAQVDELRRWHEVSLGRESRVLELKREVNELLAKAGQPARYASAEEKKTP